MNFLTFFNAPSNFIFCESPHIYTKIHRKINVTKCQHEYLFMKTDCDVYEIVAFQTIEFLKGILM